MHFGGSTSVILNQLHCVSRTQLCKHEETCVCDPVQMASVLSRPVAIPFSAAAMFVSGSGKYLRQLYNQMNGSTSGSLLLESLSSGW